MDVANVHSNQTVRNLDFPDLTEEHYKTRQDRLLTSFLFMTENGIKACKGSTLSSV